MMLLRCALILLLVFLAIPQGFANNDSEIKTKVVKRIHPITGVPFFSIVPVKQKGHD